MNIFGSTIFLVSFALVAQCMDKGPEEFHVIFVPKPPTNPIVEDALMRVIDSNACDRFGVLEGMALKLLGQDKDKLVDGEVLLLKNITDAVLKNPGVPIYVEGLFYSDTPLVLNDELLEEIKAIFKDYRLDRLTRRQQLYLMGYGAVLVAQAIGIVPAFHGVEQVTFMNGHEALLRHLFDRNSLVDDLPEGYICDDRECEVNYFAWPREMEFLHDALSFVNHAREHFAVKKICEDARKLRHAKIILIFDTDQIDNFEKAFSEADCTLVVDRSALRESTSARSQASDQALDAHFSWYEASVKDILHELYDHYHDAAKDLSPKNSKHFSEMKSVISELLGAADYEAEQRQLQFTEEINDIAEIVAKALEICIDREDFSTTVLQLLMEL